MPLLDARDGRTYATVRTARRIWMAVNLNHSYAASWCYADDPARCEAEGRLYSWYAALQACPVGWELPGDEDWLALISEFGGHYVLAEKRAVGDPHASYAALVVSGASGLMFRLSGWRDTTAAARSADLGEDGIYWSASHRGADSVSLFVLNRHYGRVLWDRDNPDFAASVRCVTSARGA